jgi:hypothetical protein
MAARAVTSSASTPWSYGCREQPLGRGPNPDQPCAFIGTTAPQPKEPPDHGPGYSHGGLRTKIHLMCDNHGIRQGIHVTPREPHESTTFEIIVERVLLPHRYRTQYWPEIRSTIIPRSGAR